MSSSFDLLSSSFSTGDTLPAIGEQNELSDEAPGLLGQAADLNAELPGGEGSCAEESDHGQKVRAPKT